MRNLFEVFLSLPVGGRATIFWGILFLLWCFLGRLLLKIGSFFPWILKRITFWIYMILEIPVSILHSKFGSVFGDIDKGLTTIAEKVCAFMDQLFDKMNKPKTIYRGWVLVVYLVISAYLLIPISANLTEKPFTFWQASYIEKETVVVWWMNDKGWFEE